MPGDAGGWLAGFARGDAGDRSSAAHIGHRKRGLPGSVLTAAERSDLLDAFLGMSEWTRVYFGWRPNLPDDADNHLVELAVAGAARYVVTRHLRHLRHLCDVMARGEPRFPGLKVVDATTFLEELGPWLP
jgi:predicted nucleic acid-binding protein